MGRSTGVKHHNYDLHPLSVRGTTLKANSWLPFPTWPHQDGSTAAQAFWPATGNRWKYPHVLFPMYFRPCLWLEVGRTTGCGFPAPSCTFHQTGDGQEEETFQGEKFKSFESALSLQLSADHHYYQDPNFTPNCQLKKLRKKLSKQSSPLCTLNNEPLKSAVQGE